jgi:ABC-2 type transport system permease protein
MFRYLRLYLYFVRFSFSRAMEFRIDFFFRVVMDICFYATQIAFFDIIFRTTALLAGWDFDQVLIFITGFFVVDALQMTVFANNQWWFPIFVNKGDLDYYLVRPVSSLFFLSLRDFAANSFLNLLIALGLFAWAVLRYSAPIPLDHGILCLLLLANGAFLYYIIHQCFLIPVFWMHSSRGLGEIFLALQRYGERPEKIFTGVVRLTLVTILPFSLIASMPAEVLFEGLGWLRLLHIVLVTGGAFLFLRFFWQRGLRAYSSASS